MNLLLSTFFYKGDKKTAFTKLFIFPAYFHWSASLSTFAQVFTACFNSAIWSLPAAEGRILRLHCWSHSRFQCSENKHCTQPHLKFQMLPLALSTQTTAHVPRESLQKTVSASGTRSLFLFRPHLLCLKNLGVVHSLSSGRGCRHPSLKIHSRKASKGRKTSMAFPFPCCAGSPDGIWEVSLFCFWMLCLPFLWFSATNLQL